MKSQTMTTNQVIRLDELLELVVRSLRPDKTEERILLALFKQGRICQVDDSRSGMLFHLSDELILSVNRRVAPFRRRSIWQRPLNHTLSSARDSFLALVTREIRDRFQIVQEVECGRGKHLITTFTRLKHRDEIIVPIEHVSATRDDLTVDLLSAEQSCLTFIYDKHRRGGFCRTLEERGFYG